MFSYYKPTVMCNICRRRCVWLARPCIGRAAGLLPAAVLLAALLLPLFHATARAAGSGSLRKRWTESLKEYVQHTSHSKYFLGEIEKINRSNADSAAPSQLAASYYPMCRKFTERGEFLAEILFARHMYNELEKAAGTRGDSLMMAKYANSAALSYTMLKFYDEALNMFGKATAIARRHGFREVLAHVYTNQAQLYYETGEYGQALKLLAGLKSIAGEDGILYNNMALVYSSQGDAGKAVACFDSALRCAGGDGELKARILINKGSVLTDSRDYAAARKCLDEAARLLPDSASPVIPLMLHLNFVQLYIATGDMRRAAGRMEYIEKNVMPRQSNAIKGMYLKDVAGLYIRLDNYVKASECLQESIRLNDSLNYDSQKKQLFQLMTLYDIAQLRSDNIQLKNEYELAQASLRSRTVMVVAAVLVAVLLSVLVAVAVRKRRNELRQNAVIREQEQQLYALRQKEYEREKSKMENEISRKSRELTLFSIDLSSIDELHRVIGDELAALAAETGDDDVRRRISAVSLKLRKQTAHNLSEGFKKYFGEVSPAFDSKLKEAHPNLTLNDHRLCAYIYMGLTSKEISQITFKEVESVEKSRNRLRKKIGIDGSVSIRDYLSSIIDGGDVSCAEMNS